jgi:hypothetical protein
VSETPKNAPLGAPITLVDNSGAPDVFADAIVGAFVTSGNIHMTLVTRRCDYTKQPNEFSDQVIGRLVMPLAAVENAVQLLTDLIGRGRTNRPMPSPLRLLAYCSRGDHAST